MLFRFARASLFDDVDFADEDDCDDFAGVGVPMALARRFDDDDDVDVLEPLEVLDPTRDEGLAS